MISEQEITLTTTRATLQFLWELVDVCQFVGSEAERVAMARADLKNAILKNAMTDAPDEPLELPDGFHAVRVMDSMRRAERGRDNGV